MEHTPLFDDVPPRRRVIQEVSEVVVGHDHPVCLLRKLQHESEGKGQKEIEHRVNLLKLRWGKGFLT